jgi:hypothetical protein
VINIQAQYSEAKERIKDEEKYISHAYAYSAFLSFSTHGLICSKN